MMRRYGGYIIRCISLQTPGARVAFFISVSIAIYLARYEWLAHLSLWQYLNIPSPSIGLTRAYWLLLHGDPVAAWQRNKIIYLILIIGLPMIARDIYVLITQHFAKRSRV